MYSAIVAAAVVNFVINMRVIITKEGLAVCPSVRKKAHVSSLGLAADAFLSERGPLDRLHRMHQRPLALCVGDGAMLAFAFKGGNKQSPVTRFICRRLPGDNYQYTARIKTCKRKMFAYTIFFDTL